MSTLSPTAARIKSRWDRELRGFGNNLTYTALPGGVGAPTVYSGSSFNTTSADFGGDWRSADAWMRFEAQRVIARSRQLANGNPMVIAFLRNMGNNILGFDGMHFQNEAMTSGVFGDSTAGEFDVSANEQIEANYVVQGLAEYLTTTKDLDRQDLDRLLLNKLIIDGEFIVQKVRGFQNDFNFAWKVIDRDYLDVNLNRIEDGRDENGVMVATPGNITKMGIEYDCRHKFKVAFWFLVSRPNDSCFDYLNGASYQRSVRVPADEVIHVFVKTLDSEQSRGWPWIFSAVVNLFRSEKYHEAALINATIGASKTTYFKKEYPEGYDGSGTDSGRIPVEVVPGAAEELPMGVTPVGVDMRYPDAEIGPFLKAMNLWVGCAFGTSYMTTTGDMSEANFVASRIGQNEEREHFKACQSFFARKWKLPSFDEELYRSFLAGKIRLPISKYEKFHKPVFTGRRWPFIQPVDDARAMEILLNNRTRSVSSFIREAGGNPRKVFAEIQRDETEMNKLNIARLIHLPKPMAVDEVGTDATDGTPAKAATKPSPAK